MGAMGMISAFGDDRGALMRGITRAIVEFQRLDNLLTIFNESSQVSRLNALGGREMVPVDEDVADILRFSVEMSWKTSGVFDITVGPLMDLWGFRGKKKESVPAEREIAAVLESMGPDKIFVDEGERTAALLHPGTRIDLGGVGVGYAVDRAVKILKAEGIDSAFVNHSGDAYALGVPDESEGWEIGIPDPGNPEILSEKFLLCDAAVATSGGYRQFVTIGPHRFAHIIDPRSGIPGQTLQSVSLIARNAVTADALSTSLFCVGTEGAGRLLDIFPETSFIGLTRHGDETAIQIINDPRKGK